MAGHYVLSNWLGKPIGIRVVLRGNKCVISNGFAYATKSDFLCCSVSYLPMRKLLRELAISKGDNYHVEQRAHLGRSCLPPFDPISSRIQIPAHRSSSQFRHIYSHAGEPKNVKQWNITRIGETAHILIAIHIGGTVQLMPC